MEIKKTVLAGILFTGLFASCGQYNKVLKSTDPLTRYEAAKEYYAEGKYSKATNLIEDLINILKGTDKAEESLYMLGMSYYNNKEYTTAATVFTKYYNSYPRGQFTELARFYAGKSLYMDAPEPKLDQSGTYRAMQELQLFLEYFPQSNHRQEAGNMIFEMQDKLVKKEYLAAKLYFNLGNYRGNNYRSCIIAAQNALKDYPYTNMREQLSMLILKARYELARNSIISKRDARYRETIDEYYAFKTDYPESKYLKEAKEIFNKAEKALGEDNKEKSKEEETKEENK